MPHELGMRSYAHTKAKHAKMDFLSKHATLTLLGHNTMSSKSYQSTNMLIVTPRATPETRTRNPGPQVILN